MRRLEPGARGGTVVAPRSKSLAHRLLIADVLAGGRARLAPEADDSADVLATKRCLAALVSDGTEPVLDCGESGSTRRFLAPIATVLGKRPVWKTAGRLGVRPTMDFSEIASGEFTLPGDVSSQFVTGLLFALPLLRGDSRIRFTTPLQSRGYVDVTLSVLIASGIRVTATADGGYDIPGGQTYRTPPVQVEGDWSGAAFWLAMNALGSQVRVTGLDGSSAQPDRAVIALLGRFSERRSAGGGSPLEMDVSACPDLFPALSVVAACHPFATRFTGTRRLRIKESDRTAAMAEALGRFGVSVEVGDDTFGVIGTDRPLQGGAFRTFSDHRIAMAVAVGATRADRAVFLDEATCVAKSYPRFFELFDALRA